MQRADQRLRAGLLQGGLHPDRQRSRPVQDTPVGRTGLAALAGVQTAAPGRRAAATAVLTGSEPVSEKTNADDQPGTPGVHRTQSDVETVSRSLLRRRTAASERVRVPGKAA